MLFSFQRLQVNALFFFLNINYHSTTDDLEHRNISMNLNFLDVHDIQKEG